MTEGRRLLRGTLEDTAALRFSRRSPRRQLRCRLHQVGASIPSRRGRGLLSRHGHLARFFGIPTTLIPPDRDAFAAYLDDVLSGDEIGASATSARVVRDVLWFQRWFVAPPAMSALRILAIGTLDPRLASRLGLELTKGERQRFNRVDNSLRRHYSRLPSARTSLPYGYLAMRRSVRRPQRARRS